jgi:hypothetical protein
MGFDLCAKRAKRGATTYYRAGTEYMGFLRCAMVAAGVPETLVYKKFVSNDDWLVTPRQSEMIAEKLTAWLQGRSLVLELAETQRHAHLTLENLHLLHGALGKQNEADRIARNLHAKSRIVRVDRAARQSIREFAAFCAGSGGFYVD